MTYFVFLINMAVISGLGYLLWQKEPPGRLKKFLLPALILKLVAGGLLGLYYQVYFGGGDAQLFQTQSDYVTEYGRVSPASYVRLLLTRKFESETLRTSMIYVWYSNSYFMVMLLGFLNFITGGNYYLNGLYFSLFCFFGLWQLVKVLVKINSNLLVPAVLSFLFLPSVVFWASGISKEAVYLGSLGWLLAGTLRLIYHLSTRPWVDVLSVLVAGYLLWKIKFYFAALVFALLFGYGIIQALINQMGILKIKTVPKILLFCFLVLVGGLIVSNWSEVLKLDYFLAELIKSNAVLTHLSVEKPYIAIPDLEPSLISVMQHSPQAVFNTFMRPFIWEDSSFFYVLAGLENLAISLLLLFTLFIIVRNQTINISLGAFVILIYVIALAIILGLSTPNIGSLSRYRTAILPFLIFLLLSIHYTLKNSKVLKQ